MSDLAEQVEQFHKEFLADEKMQQEYLADPEAFLKSDAVPREYGDEILANMQGIQSMSASIEASGPDAVLSGPRPDESILTGPKKGKPKISFQTTKGYFSIVTGYYLVLNNQATDDVADGLLIGAALTAMICAADPELLSKSVAGIIAGALTIESKAMKLVNRGKGVYFYMNPLTFSMVSIVVPAVLAVSLIPLPN